MKSDKIPENYIYWWEILKNQLFLILRSLIGLWHLINSVIFYVYILNLIQNQELKLMFVYAQNRSNLLSKFCFGINLERNDEWDEDGKEFHLECE